MFSNTNYVDTTNNFSSNDLFRALYSPTDNHNSLEIAVIPLRETYAAVFVQYKIKFKKKKEED